MGENAIRRLWVLLLVVAVAFGATAQGGLFGIWWWWGVGFDEAETLGMAKPSTDAAMETSFWIAMTGFAGLSVTAVLAGLAAVRSRRRRT